MGVTALWVGDSFTRGEGAEVSQEQTYPHLVSARLGWLCHVDAQNGTGFLNDGFLAGPGLAALIDRLPETTRRVCADVVIIDAGRNDGMATEPGLRAAASRYLAALREAYPRARLIVVLPTLLDPVQPPEYQQIAIVLRQVAQAHGWRSSIPPAMKGSPSPVTGPTWSASTGSTPASPARSITPTCSRGCCGPWRHGHEAQPWTSPSAHQLETPVPRATHAHAAVRRSGADPGRR